MRWLDGKYGEGEPTNRLRPNEPYFFLRAQDQLSVPALEAYAASLRAASDELAVTATVAVAERLLKQARDVDAIVAHFQAWQKNHADLVKLPD